MAMVMRKQIIKGGNLKTGEVMNPRRAKAAVVGVAKLMAARLIGSDLGEVVLPMAEWDAFPNRALMIEVRGENLIVTLAAVDTASTLTPKPAGPTSAS
jgi:hypothetical protein